MESYTSGYSDRPTIAHYPDFDQILAVTIASKSLPFNENLSPLTVTIPGRDDSKLQRLVAKDKRVVGQVGGNGNEIEFGVVKQVHYEGDLEIQR